MSTTFLVAVSALFTVINSCLLIAQTRFMHRNDRRASASSIPAPKKPYTGFGRDHV